MNAYISFRANGLGNMSPSRSDRQAALEDITGNLRAKTTGLLRAKGYVPKQEVQNSSGNTRVVDNELSRDAFLQLLVTQMQNQDPLEPVENTEMIAQLAQFSSLEQMTQVSEGVEQLSENINLLNGNVDQLNFISAQGLLGRYVEGIDQEGKVIRGRVDSVHLNGSLVVLTVDGQLLPMSGVAGVGTEPLPEPAAEDATKEGFLKRIFR